MVVVGADVHKQTHTLVAVDETGRRLGEKVVKAISDGHAEAVMWARERFGADLIWGIEDCRNMSARLERDLLSAGQKVVRVPTKLMSQVRASARTRGKSDPIDALAVARAVLREPDLPVASHDELSRELKLLVDRREVLLTQRTSAINRLRWWVHELDPTKGPKPRSLNRAKPREALRVWLDTVAGVVAELAREELADITRLSEQIDALAERTAPECATWPRRCWLSVAVVNSPPPRLSERLRGSPDSKAKQLSLATPASPPSRSGRATLRAGYG
jgi:transposase